MTNQLLLAQVLAAGFDWDYFWHWTHDQELGKVLISAIPPIATAAIAALSLILTALRETKQMELSKQGTPPELTRYKEWLEVSERYKELVGVPDACNLTETSEEYREIESSRKEALTRAVWERKVISVCPNVRGQKRLLNVPASLVVHGDKRIITLPNFRYGIYLWIEVLIIVSVFMGMLITMVLVVGSFATSLLSGAGDIIETTVSFIFVVLVCLYALIYGINLVESTRMSLSGERFAEYGYLRILQENLPNDKFKDVFKSSLNKMNNSQRFFFALWDENYRNFVYCPKWIGSKYFSVIEPFILGLPYWIINWGSGKRGYDYGEYKPETFGISEKVSEGEQTEQDENLKGKKASVSKRIVLWISKKWESLNRS